MSKKFVEPLLLAPISSLDFTREFCLICELGGFHTLADLLQIHTRELLKLPGFNYHLLCEMITFLEKRHMAHYIDPI